MGGRVRWDRGCWSCIWLLGPVELSVLNSVSFMEMKFWDGRVWVKDEISLSLFFIFPVFILFLSIHRMVY